MEKVIKGILTEGVDIGPMIFINGWTLQHFLDDIIKDLADQEVEIIIKTTERKSEDG